MGTVINDDGEQIWPPTLDELKADMGSQYNTGEDAQLQMDLDKAIAYVQRVRRDLRFTQGSQNPDPSVDIKQGTLRLAWRWRDRRRNMNGLLEMAEFGVRRVPGTDPDIDKMLGIGKYMRSVIA